MGVLCWAPSKRNTPEDDLLDQINCEVAVAAGYWLRRSGQCIAKIFMFYGREATLVSIAGAAQDGADLTILASCGPGASAAPPGRVLSSPWPAGGADNGSSFSRPPGASVSRRRWTPLSWKSGSPPARLPADWHQLLSQARQSEPLCLQAQLEPLVLGGRLVGALLVVTQAGQLPGSRSAPTSAAGRPLGDVVPAAKSGSGFGWSLRRLWRRPVPSSSSGSSSSSSCSAPSPGLMRGLASALSQVAFGPHLRAVSMLCTATQSLRASVSLYDMSRVLSMTLSEILAADFHVNLAVRVAVVPPQHCSHGYLLVFESQTGGGGAGRMVQRLFGRESGSLQRSAGSTPEPQHMGPLWKGGFTLPAMTAAGTSARGAQHPHGFIRREDSFVGASPASAPNVLLLGSSSLLPRGDNKVSPFALSSSLLMQLLRPGGPARTGPAGTGGMARSLSAAVLQGGSAGEEPLERMLRMPPPKAYETTLPPSSLTDSCQPMLDFSRSESVFGAARNSTASGMQTHAGAASSSTTGGAAAAPSPSPAFSSCYVSGLVVANLNAWMQDVERPSSDVALLMMAARGKGTASGAGTALPAGGGASPAASAAAPAAGSGPACLVAVAGCAAARLQPCNGGVVGEATRSVCGELAGRSTHKGLSAPSDWTLTAADAAAHIAGAMYGNGSVRYDSDGGGGGGPCVAVYITASERLPTSLLRAIKDRAVALMELLLPACLGTLSAGPVREQVELLAEQTSSGHVSTSAAGSSRSKQPPASSFQGTPTAPGYGNGGVTGAAMPPRPLPSPASPFLSQLHLPSPLAAISPINSVVVVEERSQLSMLGQRLIHTLAGPRGSQSSIAAATDAPRRLLSLMSSVELAKSAEVIVTAGPGVGLKGSQLFASTSAVGTEIPLIALRSGAAGAAGVSGGAAAAATATAAAAAALSPFSRGMQGTGTGCGLSPGEYCSSGGGASLATLLQSVSGGANDQLASMRENLDVWVNSFMGMLKEAPIQASHMHGSYADDDLRFLRLYQRLGSGGAASVYAGVLLGMDVAVKVIEPPPEIDMEALASTRTRGDSSGDEEEEVGEEAQDEGERIASLAAALRQAQMRELVRSARECAVLTSLSHPSIVQVYSYHTRVAVLPGDGPDDLPRLLPVAPGETCPEAQGPLHLVIIMERCDLGSLADALDNGMFRKAIIAAASALPAPVAAPARRPGPLPGATSASGGGSTSMRAIYLTLLEVALALRHLHSMNLVHCDVKVANVLLKSCPSDIRGFTCKLSDFGLVNLLRAEEEAHDQEQEQGQGQPPAGDRKPWMRNADVAGTVTHLAPECFEPGSQLDQSVDIYAFGIVMWEVFTRKPPYAEFAPTFEDLPCRVMEGLRPRFPSHCPAHFRSLAQACWSGDPAQRPTAAAVVSRLQSFMEGTPTVFEQARQRQAGPVGRGTAGGG